MDPFAIGLFRKTDKTNNGIDGKFLRTTHLHRFGGRPSGNEFDFRGDPFEFSQFGRRKRRGNKDSFGGFPIFVILGRGGPLDEAKPLAQVPRGNGASQLGVDMGDVVGLDRDACPLFVPGNVDCCFGVIKGFVVANRFTHGVP